MKNESSSRPSPAIDPNETIIGGLRKHVCCLSENSDHLRSAVVEARERLLGPLAPVDPSKESCEPSEVESLHRRLNEIDAIITDATEFVLRIV